MLTIVSELMLTAFALIFFYEQTYYLLLIIAIKLMIDRAIKKKKSDYLCSNQFHILTMCKIAFRYLLFT